MDTAWPLTWPKKAEELYIFDPKGDVLLILERRLEKDTTEFIDEGASPVHWGDEPEPAAEEDIPPECPPSSEEIVPDWLEPDSSIEHDPIIVENDIEVTPENDLVKPFHSTGCLSSASWMTKSIVQKVQMRVSSKHLILALVTFNTSLGSDMFPEGRKLQIDGNVVIPLPDEDPDAMVILLNIIHGLTRKVPRQVSLEMLSRLAFVVNHRQMHEAVDFFSDSWIEDLKRASLPEGSDIPEVLSWLFIFWVFQKGDGFKSMSEVLVRESDDSLEGKADAGPPIPSSIIRNIQKRRLDGIESAIEVIHGLITKYSSTDILCHGEDGYACDAVLLGSLVKSSAIIGIWPRPMSPYPGITFKTLSEQIQQVQVLDECRYANRGYYNSSRNHQIKPSIEALMSSLEDSICGLKLKPFLPKQKRKVDNVWGIP